MLAAGLVRVRMRGRWNRRVVRVLRWPGLVGGDGVSLWSRASFALRSGRPDLRGAAGLCGVFVRHVRVASAATGTAVGVHRGPTEIGEPVMRPSRCELCATPVDLDVAHDWHDPDCDRFLNGYCTCDAGVVCAGCCPDSACVTPLAARLRAAHDRQQAGVE